VPNKSYDETSQQTAGSLKPSSTIWLINGDEPLSISPSDITPELVGLKAFGLACLPQTWTKPFFVIESNTTPTAEQLQSAATNAGLSLSKSLIIRSSGTQETIDRRGSLDSRVCNGDSILSTLKSLREDISNTATDLIGSVHWILQEHATPRKKGHLSNERRIAEKKRDWVVEVEVSPGMPGEFHKISLRQWRDKRNPSLDQLRCLYRESIIDMLTQAAKWAHGQLLRVHFEWVWTGQALFIVQADACESNEQGVDPKKLVTSIAPKGDFDGSGLKLFRPIIQEDFENYRKLKNVRLYTNIGYNVGTFYILDDAELIKSILTGKKCSKALLWDLKILTQRSLVLRTDGRDIPKQLHQMLPRSDELRSQEDAKQWLENKFTSDRIIKSPETQSDLADYSLCLIAHHFISATAAAWCKAHPDERRVRIESLWGIPEGLYWYAYDSFDVDTQVSDIRSSVEMPKDIKVRPRLRYKEHFIAPDSSGSWILQRTSTQADWQSSITKTAWIEEIAWTSRRIAEAAAQPVVVMWFIDIPKSMSKHSVLPWYHEAWMQEGSIHKAAPRKKTSSKVDYEISTKEDWNRLKELLKNGTRFSRVTVSPREPEIVRSPSFAAELGSVAKANNFVIELRGGILSHAYYLLSKAGCTVECADLDDYATEEEEAEFNKLVRDEIPNLISTRGESVNVLALKGEALIESLKRKLVEESLEVLDAKTNDQLVEELADLREVILNLMERLNIQDASVESSRRAKAKKRGTFSNGLMLTRTAVAPPLSLKGDDDKPFIEIQQSITAPSISTSAELPAATDGINIDRRHNHDGQPERLLTVTLPTYASGFKSISNRFDLKTQEGYPHDMNLDISLDRSGSDLRLRVTLTNSPLQLSLDLNGEEEKPEDR